MEGCIRTFTTNDIDLVIVNRLSPGRSFFISEMLGN